MWQRVGDLYNQLPSVRNLWAQPAAPAVAVVAPDPDINSSAESFDTADEVAPSLRVQTPRGHVYAPSVPSSTVASTARAGRGPAAAVDAAQISIRPVPAGAAVPVERAAQARAARPFHSPPPSDDRTPYPPDSASAHPASSRLAADFYPPHDGYGATEPHSARPWHDGFSYVGPAGAAIRTPSRSSGRTVLHEAHGRPSADELDEPHGAQRPGARPSRAELLEWERARREAERGEARERGGPPTVHVRGERELDDVRSSWGWEEATEGLREPGKSVAAEPDERGEEVRVDEVLMQDWLLQPPPDRAVTDGLLSFPDMWHAVYAILTPSHLYLLDDADVNADALIAFAVADVANVELISKHARRGFEPFCVKLRGGDALYFAGTETLDAELWSLKIKNAQSGAYRRSSTLVDDLDVVASSDPSSSSTRPRRCASSPPTPFSSRRPRTSSSRNLVSPPRHDQKDPRWMRSFHADVHVRPVLVEELAPHASADDWGRTSPPSRSSWPARPPAEVYSPPSPPSTVRREAQHALELGVMRDRLELVRAVLTGQQEGLEGDAARAREAAQELEGLKERLVLQAEREGRALSEDEERLLEKIEWIEHLNGLRRRTSAEQDELARVIEEEARLADELRRELEALGAVGHGAGSPGQYATGAREEEGAASGRTPTRSDEHHQNVPHDPVDDRAPALPVRRVDLPSKFSSNSSAPRRYPPRHYRPTLSPLAQVAYPDVHDPRPQQHPSEQGSVSQDEDAERRFVQRRRLQELFLEVEARMLNQKRHLAASEDKNRQLTRTLGKVVKLVEHSSSTHSSQLSALLDKLDTLTAQLHLPTHLAALPAAFDPSSSPSSSSASRSTPTPPPPYHPTSPLVRLGRAPLRPPHGPRVPRPVTAESLALVPGDGRMAPRVMPRRAAQALVGRTSSGAAGAAGGQPGFRAGGPVYGVDAALPQHAHDPRWAAGAAAARRARELDAQQRQLDAPAPPARPVVGVGTKDGGAVERGEAKARVDGALQELRRGVGREGDPAKAALAVWELLDSTRRARTEREEGKKAAKKTEREKKRGGGGGGFRLGGARGRAL
ncbi:hypothetical protein JCM3775_002810 [Rhodotorula graminis]